MNIRNEINYKRTNSNLRSILWNADSADRADIH